ncbi:hypothetical protein PsorP6_008948 [Peronosclerospora sorghi]|uniref:Uncharacterized protein n=1 Tax=Peronosclerospora sorghi TaxID=230839 RepID=A0ACC0VYR0_9STRA|nr:hypothetical protein PsorP6_008948 [Peronosclerospora sorghi]
MNPDDKITPRARRSLEDDVQNTSDPGKNDGSASPTPNQTRDKAIATHEHFAEIKYLRTRRHAAQAGARSGSSSTTLILTTPRIKDLVCSSLAARKYTGFEDFILELEQAIATEALLNQLQWTTQIKALRR